MSKQSKIKIRLQTVYIRSQISNKMTVTTESHVHAQEYCNYNLSVNNVLACMYVNLNLSVISFFMYINDKTVYFDYNFTVKR